MISVCKWWSCTYKDFFVCFSCLLCGGLLSYGHLKGKLHVLACELRWGLNVDHWLVAVVVSLLTVLSLCSLLFSFFDPLCTSIYSFKGNKGCVVIIII